MHPYIPNLVMSILFFLVPAYDYFYQDGNANVGLLPILTSIILLSLNNGVKFDILPQVKAAAWAIGITVLGIGYAVWSHHKESGGWLWEYSMLGMVAIITLIIFVLHIRKLKAKATNQMHRTK